MSDLSLNTDHLLELVGTVCSKVASGSDFVELNSILLADEVSRRRYLNYCRMHVALRMELRAHRALQKVCRQISTEPVVIASGGSSAAGAEIERTFPLPFGFLSTPFHDTLGYFSDGMPLAYLLATVITGFSLLGFWLMPASRPEQVARNAEPSVVLNQSLMWGGSPAWSTASGTEVLVSPRGRSVELASGLMEITYDTGAKVILQGPVTYSVEANGGYLAVGKLTGKLEKKVASADSLHSLTTNHGPATSSNPLSAPPPPL